MEGATVVELTEGQELVLGNDDGEPLTRVQLGLGWTEAKTAGFIGTSARDRSRRLGGGIRGRPVLSNGHLQATCRPVTDLVGGVLGCGRRGAASMPLTAAVLARRQVISPCSSAQVWGLPGPTVACARVSAWLSLVTEGAL